MIKLNSIAKVAKIRNLTFKEIKVGKLFFFYPQNFSMLIESLRLFVYLIQKKTVAFKMQCSFMVILVGILGSLKISRLRQRAVLHID